MKKILFFILFANLINKTTAQDYTPMLEESKVWNMLYSWYDLDGKPPFNNGNELFIYKIEGSTTINSINYFNLNDSRTNNTFYLREDIATKKVYQYLENSNEEVILYDFDISIGEIFNAHKLNLVYPDPYYRTVIDIGYETKYGINTKYYTIDQGCMKIYEGIGLTPDGLIEFPILCAPIDKGHNFTLINMNQLLIVEDYFTQNNIKLFYNKKDKKLQLTNTLEKIKVEIYSVLGKKIITKTDNSLDVSQFQKGIYFYNLSKNNTVKKGKVFIY